MATFSNPPSPVTERLKHAREARGLSHRQIADVTRLSARVIQALEEGRLHQLPPGIYRRSIVRAVAREVGLDPEALLRAFLDEYPDAVPLPVSASVVAEPASTSHATWRRALAMLGAVVPLLAGVAYFGRTPVTRSSDDAPVRHTVRGPGVWRPEIVPAGGFSEAPPPLARPVAMLIAVSARCQLRVTADGGLLAARMFEPGESLRFAFSEGVDLSGDNAGAVQYSLNGQAGRQLGAAGQPLSAHIGRDDYPLFLSGR